MRHIVILFLSILTTTCFAQTNISSLFNFLNRPVDVTSCYKPTPGVVLHAESGETLFQSTDGGTTWQSLGQELPENLKVSTAFVKEEEIYLGTMDGKFYRGYGPEPLHWDLQEMEGKTSTGPVFGVYAEKSGIYARTYNEGFYRLVPGTNYWKPMHQNLEDKSVYSVVETAEGTLMVASPKGIYESANDGKTWKSIYSDSWVNNLIYKNNTIIANSPQGLIRSDDHGKEWNCVLHDEGGHYNLRVIDGYFVAIRVAGPWNTASQHPASVIVSMDGGNTWHCMATGKPDDTRIYDLVKVGDYLFSSRNGGISRSFDMGKTWQLLITPPVDNDRMIFELMTSGSTLFAYLRENGC